MIVPEPDRAHIRRTVADRGLELEELREDSRAADWHVTVVVDGDSGVTLDDLARLSTDLDALAEQWGGPDRAVTFEVTSRGVDAPLEEPRHWRRARGRQVDVTYVDGVEGPSRGRVGDLDEETGTVRLVSRSGRGMRVDSVTLDAVARAVIRVEFRPAPEDELALLSEPENPGRGVREGEDS
ncbi:ribosome maturation factor RimP [Dietzia psychralcaliphila]|uniref:Ribosome maturation factor RimP n=1 Tax=Dietzia psychralcaliphila TaxID=139021 RepID=A0AAD0NMR7_9ACTN|nr:ribosome maturation protein RimP [Dietzia psychralcaliphila]AWH95650.1 ribosome maturation protein RimP [Dietzia psychralcaliphila]PTM88587.1 ribosome maturation factor RimP [Dietzia psychralcaliphila]